MLKNKVVLFFLNSFSCAFMLIIMFFLTFVGEGLIRFGKVGTFPQGGGALSTVGLSVGIVQAAVIAILLYRQKTVSAFFIALSTFLTAQIIDLYYAVPHFVMQYYLDNQKIEFSNNIVRFTLLNSILLLFCIFYGIVNKLLINRLVNKDILI